MAVIDIFPWRVHYDNISTSKAYEKIHEGYAQECRCAPCLNFIEVRERVYPEKAKKLFQEFGIDYKKEAEVFHLNRIRQGLHLYGGWFHFIGNVECVDDAELGEDKRLTHYIQVDENFSWSFSNNNGAPHDKVFNGRQLCIINLSINVSWVISAAEPE